MDSDIIELVDNIFDKYKGKNISYVCRKSVIDYTLISKKHFDPNIGGSFNSFFSTIIKKFMIHLYRMDKERIELVISRDKKIYKLWN